MGLLRLLSSGSAFAGLALTSCSVKVFSCGLLASSTANCFGNCGNIRSLTLASSAFAALGKAEGVLLGLLLGLSALIAGGAQSTSDKIVAKELSIVDNDGNERVVIAGDDNGVASVRIFDAEGIARISSGVNKDNSSYTQWFDAAGKSRIAALCSPSGQSSVQWRDANGNVRIGGATMNNGDSTMMWMAPNGKPQIKVMTDTNGNAKFVSGD